MQHEERHHFRLVELRVVQQLSVPEHRLGEVFQRVPRYHVGLPERVVRPVVVCEALFVALHDALVRVVDDFIAEAHVSHDLSHVLETGPAEEEGACEIDLEFIEIFSEALVYQSLTSIIKGRHSLGTKARTVLRTVLSMVRQGYTAEGRYESAYETAIKKSARVLYYGPVYQVRQGVRYDTKAHLTERLCLSRASWEPSTGAWDLCMTVSTIFAEVHSPFGSTPRLHDFLHFVVHFLHCFGNNVIISASFCKIWRLTMSLEVRSTVWDGAVRHDYDFPIVQNGQGLKILLRMNSFKARTTLTSSTSFSRSESRVHCKKWRNTFVSARSALTSVCPVRTRFTIVSAF